MQGWNASKAKVYFSQILDNAVTEPQLVYRHGKPTGVLLSYEEYMRNRHHIGTKPLSAWFDELQQIDEGDFTPPERSDRKNTLFEP